MFKEQKQPAKDIGFCRCIYRYAADAKLFRSELLPKDNRYASVVYYAAVSAFNLEKNSGAGILRYLNTGTEAQQKDWCLYEHDLSSRKICGSGTRLEQAIAKYPVSLDFLYNLVNVHIATNNMEKLIGAIDRILAVDPNNDKVLPIKAHSGTSRKECGALDIYKRQAMHHPESFELMTGGSANFN